MFRTTCSAVKVTGADNALIRGSRFEIMRVFQNLLKNAIEAGATKAVADFSTMGDKVLVTITDNGPGMDEDRVHRVSRGGFTSKENRSEEHTSELQSPCNLV